MSEDNIEVSVVMPCLNEARGQRFLMLKEGGTATADDPVAGLTQIHVVQNWFEELKARAPTGQ